MNKGIVLKITKEYAVILTEGNQYFTIKVKDRMVIGQKIYFLVEDIVQPLHKTRTNKHLANWKKTISYSAIAACLLLFFFLGGISGLLPGEKGYFAVVSVDINPSIELEINQESNVISVRTMNQEGQIIAGQDLIGMPIEQAVTVVIHNAQKHNYLTTASDTILLAAAINPSAKSLKKDEIDSEKAVLAIIDRISEANLPKEYTYLYLQADHDSYLQAKKHALSIGKYEVMALTEGALQAEQIKKMKVKDILDQNTVSIKLKEKNSKKAIWNPAEIKKEDDPGNIENQAGYEGKKGKDEEDKREKSDNNEPSDQNESNTNSQRIEAGKDKRTSNQDRKADADNRNMDNKQKDKDKGKSNTDERDHN